MLGAQQQRPRGSEPRLKCSPLRVGWLVCRLEHTSCEHWSDVIRGVSARADRSMAYAADSYRQIDQGADRAAAGIAEGRCLKKSGKRRARTTSTATSSTLLGARAMRGLMRPTG